MPQVDELYWTLKADTSQLTSGVAAATGKLGRFAQFMKGPGGPVAAVAALGAVATIVAVKVTKMAAELDKALREVATLLPQTSDQMGALRQRVIALSTQVPEPPAQLTKALYQTISAGVTDTAEAFDVLTVASKAAVAGLTDTFTAVDAITTVLNAYQMETSEATHISDVFFTAVREGKLVFADIAANIGDVATSAALAGVSIEEVSAAFATMTKFGIGASEAATALNRFILSVTQATDDQVAAAKRLGIEWNTTTLRSRGLLGFMADLNRVTQGNLDLLAEMNPNIRAARAAFILAGDGVAEYTRILDAANNSTGNAQSAFDDMKGALDTQATLLKNKVNAIWLEFGQTTLMKVVIPALENLNRMLEDDTERQIRLLDELGRHEEAHALRQKQLIDERVEGYNDMVSALRDSLRKVWNEIARATNQMELVWKESPLHGKKTMRGFEMPEWLRGQAFPQIEIYDMIKNIPALHARATREVQRLNRELEQNKELTKEERTAITEMAAAWQRVRDQSAAALDQRRSLYNETEEKEDQVLKQLKEERDLLLMGAEAEDERVKAIDNAIKRREIELAIMAKQAEITALMSRVWMQGAVLPGIGAGQGLGAGAYGLAMGGMPPQPPLPTDLEQTQEQINELTQRGLELLRQRQELNERAKEQGEESVAAARAALEVTQEQYETERNERLPVLEQLKQHYVTLGVLIEAASKVGAPLPTSGEVDEKAKALREQLQEVWAGVAYDAAQAAVVALDELRIAWIEKFGEMAGAAAAQWQEAYDAALAGVFVAKSEQEATDVVTAETLAAWQAGSTELETQVRLLHAQVGVWSDIAARADQQLQTLDEGSAAYALLKRFLDQVLLKLRALGIEAEKLGKDQVKTAEQIKAEKDKELQDWLTTITLIDQAVSGAVQFAESVGLIGEEVAGVVTGLGQMASGFASIKAGIGIGGLQGLGMAISGGLGMLGAAASIGQSLFGPSPEEQARRRAVEQNTEALKDLRRSYEEQARIARQAPGEVLDQLLNVFSSFNEEGPFGIPFLDLTTAASEAMAAAKRAGLSVDDLNYMLGRMGIEVELVEGKLESWIQVGQALAEIQLTDVFAGAEGALERLRLEFQLWDVDDPIDQLERFRQELNKLSNLEMPAFDLKTPEGRKLAEQWIQQQFGRISPETLAAQHPGAPWTGMIQDLQAAGGLMTPEALGELDVDALIDLLTSMESLIDEANKDAEDSAEGQATSFQTVSRITLEQADMLIAQGATQIFYLKAIAESMGYVERATGVSKPTTDGWPKFGPRDPYGGTAPVSPWPTLPGEGGLAAQTVMRGLKPPTAQEVGRFSDSLNPITVLFNDGAIVVNESSDGRTTAEEIMRQINTQLMTEMRDRMRGTGFAPRRTY